MVKFVKALPAPKQTNNNKQLHVQLLDSTLGLTASCTASR